MDRFVYEQLRRNRPELRLPLWWHLRPTDRHKAKRLTIEQMVAARMQRVLIHGDKIPDRLAVKAKPEIIYKF